MPELPFCGFGFLVQGFGLGRVGLIGLRGLIGRREVKAVPCFGRFRKKSSFVIYWVAICCVGYLFCSEILMAI